MSYPSERERLRRHRRAERAFDGPFKMVVLNVYGWATLLGAGLVIGALVTIASSVPAWAALSGGVVWAVLSFLLADHVRWRGSEVALGFQELTQALGESIVAELRARGIKATYRDQTFDIEEEPVRSIVCRRSDAGKVQAFVREYLGRT